MADSKPTVGSKWYIRIGGTLYPTGEGVVVRPGGVTREPVAGSDYHGYKETLNYAEIEIPFINTVDVDPDAIRDTKDATLIAEEDNGRTWTYSNAFSEGGPEASGGELKAKFFAEPGVISYAS